MSKNSVYKQIGVSVILTTLLMGSVFAHKSYSQVIKGKPQELLSQSIISEDPKIITLKLSDAGVSVGSILAWGVPGLIGSKAADWVRLEIVGNKVRIVHSTRTKNWLTQTNKWWDHPVRNIVFKPNSCNANSPTNNQSNLEARLTEIKKSYEQGLISKQEYENLRKQILNSVGNSNTANTASNNNCLITSDSDAIELKNGMRLDEGEVKIEYRQNDKWETVVFRVPQRAN